MPELRFCLDVSLVCPYGGNGTLVQLSGRTSPPLQGMLCKPAQSGGQVRPYKGCYANPLNRADKPAPTGDGASIRLRGRAGLPLRAQCYANPLDRNGKSVAASGRCFTLIRQRPCLLLHARLYRFPGDVGLLALARLVVEYLLDTSEKRANNHALDAVARWLTR